MKDLIVIFLFALSCGAAAQGKQKVNKSIDDNGKVMLLKIDTKIQGKKVHYKKSFDVNGMRAVQKDSIVNHILDSLGLPTNKVVVEKSKQ